MRGRLLGLKRIRARRGLELVRGKIEDNTGQLPVLWFQRPYLANQAVPEAEYLLHGPLRIARGAAAEPFELLNPSCERAELAVHGGRIVPIYPALGELGASVLRKLIDQALGAVDLASEIGEVLPEALLSRHGLLPLGAALAALHRPSDDLAPGLLEQRRAPAQLRLLYGELLELQLELALARRERESVARIHRYRVDDSVRAVARSLLPFRLTAAQKRALGEIVADLQGKTPMERLLQGDVGSGKTIVAAIALAVALESGVQGAFMAPTEILAEQHFAGLMRLLGHRYRLGLFTRSAPDLDAARVALARGEIQLAVGTHALVQEGTTFVRLGLAVIDEQHRFGVAQRRELQNKGARPDLLVMTATPIPRSLTLALYGDLDLSTLDELPPGRTPIATEVVTAGQRKRIYARLAKALADGARAYVVAPLIEASEQVAAASVEELYAFVAEALPQVSCAMLHGRMPPSEREATLARFARGEVAVLVATTVVEVGLDVPEATWMVIESAERFGLAQLHQLRGRVGRGTSPSTCIAIHGKATDEARRRLEVFASTTDGFRISEADLEIRGPGELLGTRQAGMPVLRVANLLLDQDWLALARDDARELLTRWNEPTLEALRARVEPRVAARRGLGAG